MNLLLITIVCLLVAGGIFSLFVAALKRYSSAPAPESDR